MTRPFSRRLAVETLESRDVPAVTVADIPSQPIPVNHPIFLPVTATSSLAAGQVTTTVASNNPAIAAKVLTGGRSIRFDVSGVDANNAPFTGSFTIRLFENEAPLATATLINLATAANGQSAYYVNKVFHRVIPGFIIQGGSPNGDGIGGSSLPDVKDEFNPDYTFASNGIVAIANAYDDNNNAQFFVTDLNLPLSTQAAAGQSSRPEYLDFNHTIVGIITSGFDTYAKIRDTPQTSPGSTVPTSKPIITGTTVFTDTQNAVIQLSPVGLAAGATANITVNAADASGPTTKAFTLTGVPDTVNTRAFLNPAPDVTTSLNTPVTVRFAATDLQPDTLTYAIRTATGAGTVSNFTNTAPPAGFTFGPIAADGTVTITPNANTVGRFTFEVGVRDQTDRTGTGNVDNAGNYDTQVVTLIVTPRVALTGPTAANTSSPVMFTATITSPATPAGTVTFTSGSTTLGTAPVVNGTATLTTSFPTGGNLPVVATYTPTDTTVPVGTSNTITVAVNGTPRVSLTGPGRAVAPGETFTLTSVVSATANSSGTITFTSGSTTLGTAPVVNGTATFSTSLPTVGTSSLMATFAPTNAANPSGTSPALAVVVATRPTVTLTGPGRTVRTDETIILTATVTGVSNPAGTVTFFANGTSLGTGTVTNGVATLATTIASPSGAPVTLTATFAPADLATALGATSAPISQAVTIVTPPVAPDTSSITLTGPGRAVAVGEMFTLTATITGPANPVGVVTFSNNGSVIGSAIVTNGVATLLTNLATAGTASLTAAFAPQSLATATAATSTAVAVMVTAATTTPTTPTTPTATVSTRVTAAAPFPGDPSEVSLTRADGTTSQLRPYEAAFNGGVTVVTGDVTGDGVPDVVIVPQSAGGAVVKVIDGATGLTVLTRLVFEERYRGGLNVVLGDLAGRGYSQIVIGAGAGGGPRVVVLDAKLSTTDRDFFAHDPAGRGGVTVGVSSPAPGGALAIVTSVPGDSATFDGKTGAKLSGGSTTPAIAGTTGTTTVPASTRAAALTATPTAASLRQMLGSTSPTTTADPLADPTAV